jgi:hypothetical protein
MAPTPPASRSVDSDDRVSLLRIAAVENIVITAIRYGSLIVCAGFVYLSIAALAGKITLAKVGVQFLGNLTVSNSIMSILTGGSILYGVGQRQLRRRAIKRLAKEKNDLERLLDSRRSSSGLTETGTTRPEDK